jgi:hypothetical protein
MELMEKCTLSESQLHRVFQELVDAGAIDEMELFMRTSLDDSTVNKAFVEIRCGVQALDNLEETIVAHDLKTPSEIAITEKVKTLGKVVGDIFSELARTG